MSLMLSPGQMAPAIEAVRLPCSGLEVRLSPPTGLEDVMLVEDPGSALELSLRVLAQLARTHEGSSPELSSLPVYDLDFLVLRLRRSLLGDRIRTDAACQERDCAARMDISFGIADYLEHHRTLPTPWRSRGWTATSAPEPGWFRLTRRKDGEEIGQFRLPTARDLLEMQHAGGTARGLAERCIRPIGLAVSGVRIIEGAMEAIAPSLSSDLHGTCPTCGAPIQVTYEPRHYCMAELRQRARYVLEDVDLLAERYHWSEREILAMPNNRRLAYVELARQSRGVG